MLGLGDLSILAAMLGSIAAALVCVIYGAVNWNRGSEDAGSEDAGGGHDAADGRRGGRK